MAYAVLPSVRSRKTRATTSSGVDLGRPRTTPWSLRTARASRVRKISGQGTAGVPSHPEREMPWNVA